VELPEDTSVESASETDYEDEDDDDEMDFDDIDGDDGFELHYVVEPNDFATKLVLRIIYSAHFMMATAIALSTTAMGKHLNKFTPTPPTENLALTTSLGHLGTALVLVAAAQSNYDAQKRALQYSMVLHMMNALYAAATGAKWSPAANAFQFIVLNMLMTGAAMWACYFYVQPEVEEEEEEEDE